MTKKEAIWREIVQKAVTKEQLSFTQKELAAMFGFSVSTVFNALKIPRTQGAIRVTGKNFEVVDTEKFLYIWATQRNLEKETVYRTFFPQSAKEIEGLMPASIIFAGYSAYTQKYGESPADYDKVYIYADKAGLEEVKKRFPPAKGSPNIFVLAKDAYLKSDALPETQIFVDLWNLKDWYAKEFLNKLKDKILDRTA